MATKTTTTNKLTNKNKGLLIGLILASLLALVFIALYFGDARGSGMLQGELDAVYSKNFYELVDNVNNAEVKLGKICASSQDDYSKKLLGELSKNCQSANNNLGGLPTGLENMQDINAFINQVGGYSQSLCDKVDKGGKLTTKDKNKLLEIYKTMQDVQNNLHKMNEKVINGYSIYEMSLKNEEDTSDFNSEITGIKTSSITYPTMIYDGPFSDSEANKKIKNLNDALVSVSKAKANIKDLYKTAADKDIVYVGETKSKFSTFDFKVMLGENTVFVQLTKQGGLPLTISGNDSSVSQKYSLADAKARAIAFMEAAGVKNMECVWYDNIEGEVYMNFAPVSSNVILYPDLVKVKVDLATGEITGYEASAYYTNHTKRNLPQATKLADEFKTQIPNGHAVESIRLVLAPIDYAEVLCYEYKTTYNDDTYYFYFNAQNGNLANILRVIETEQGSKLM